MRPASAAPSISDGASNQAVATPSTTRQSVPISVMPGTVPSPIPDDLLPDSDDVLAWALRYAVDHDPARRHLITYCRAAGPTTWKVARGETGLNPRGRSDWRRRPAHPADLARPWSRSQASWLPRLGESERPGEGTQSACSTA